jgi:4-amino-4-deoxy-L-arabinose transferase-like glycosyltransferase
VPAPLALVTEHPVPADRCEWRTSGWNPGSGQTARTLRPMTGGRRRAALPILVTLAVAFGTMAVAARWTGPEEVSLLVESLTVWGQAGSIALLWLAMAAGLGVWLLEWLGCEGRPEGERVALSLALGIAAALALDALFGTLGVLMLGRGIGAWGLVVAGLVLLVLRLRTGGVPWPRWRTAWPMVGLGIPLGVLLLAATSAPGWLWRSEFGGYDALSYHLELPKEWLVEGRLTTFTHNVYSAFPSFVEAAFFHLTILSGGYEVGALSSQCLAALLTVVAATNVGYAARRVGGRQAGWLASALYLATPWVVVVGSLAYNDGIVCLVLAASSLMVLSPPKGRGRLGIAMGLLFAGACGAKLTAVGFVVAPVAVAFLLRLRMRAIAPLAIACGVMTLLLGSWLVRNAIATGNPTFPFLSGLFGTGPWSAEQAALFASAHASPFGLAEAVGRLWTQWIAFGFGAAPSPSEPWAMQWSILPALGLVGIGTLWFVRRGGLAAALAGGLGVQLLFWLFFTHVQSRFLLPTAVPLAIGAAAILRWAPQRSREAIGTVAAIGASFLPLVVYSHEGVIRLPEPPGGLLHAPALFVGAVAAANGTITKAAIANASSEAERAAIFNSSPVSFVINHAILPDARILLVGHATPFWYRRTNSTMSYTTVWDRGMLDATCAAEPDRPEVWALRLREQGVRYVLLDWTMLRNWSEKGWLNPALTRERLTAFAQTMALRRRTPDGIEIREISETAPTTK